MMRTLVVALTMLLCASGNAQFDPSLLDSTANNLLHPAGYTTCKPGELGRVTRTGHGKQAMILIAGWGFDERAYADFAAAHASGYTVYTVTPAGFGGTAAPPMPDTSIRYSDLPWTNGIVSGILNLIGKEHLHKPIVVGHFTTGAQAALSLSLNHPDTIGRVIIMSGAPYRYYRPRTDTVWGKEQVMTAEQRNAIATAWAQRWFKSVKRTTWNDGNHRPEEYVTDTTTGRMLFDQSAGVPMPVMIQYLLEHIAYDPSPWYGEIRVPILVLIPSFSEEFFKSTYRSLNQTMTREWIKYYFQESWNSARSANPLFQFREIPGTRYFMWKDNPAGVNKAILDFITRE